MVREEYAANYEKEAKSELSIEASSAKVCHITRITHMPIFHLL